MHIQGGLKSPCNHLVSLHMGAFYKGGNVYLCLLYHVTWTVLHAWLHYSISIKTMHFGHA